MKEITMAKCQSCKKTELLDTRWEKFCKWLMNHLFPQQVIDLSEEKYGNGFGRGYKIGFEHAEKNQTPITRVTPEELFPNVKELIPMESRNARLKRIRKE